MAVFARPDETIRVQKVATGPVRILPRQFARPTRRHWVWVVVGGLSVGIVLGLLIAVGVPHFGSHSSARAKEASELLRMLRG